MTWYYGEKVTESIILVPTPPITPTLSLRTEDEEGRAKTKFYPEDGVYCAGSLLDPGTMEGVADGLVVVGLIDRDGNWVKGLAGDTTSAGVGGAGIPAAAGTPGLAVALAPIKGGLDYFYVQPTAQAPGGSVYWYAAVSNLDTLWTQTFRIRVGLRPTGGIQTVIYSEKFDLFPSGKPGSSRTWSGFEFAMPEQAAELHFYLERQTSFGEWQEEAHETRNIIILISEPAGLYETYFVASDIPVEHWGAARLVAHFGGGGDYAEAWSSPVTIRVEERGDGKRRTALYLLGGFAGALGLAWLLTREREEAPPRYWRA